MSQHSLSDENNGADRQDCIPQSTNSVNGSSESVDVDGAPFRKAFTLLLQGFRYAEASGRCIWDYAVELQDFKDAGLTSNDLRWMICNDWVDQACEIQSPVKDSRSFEHGHSLRFIASSCFVLTESGVAAADRFLRGDLDLVSTLPLAKSTRRRSKIADKSPAEVQRKPRWDAERHRLYVGSVLVKEYKLPCPNQGMILMAFQEENWPARIDDPLPPSGEIDSKTRLSSTIKSLNKNVKNRLVHFMGDGSGEGVLWEFVDPKKQEDTPLLP